MLTPFRKGSKLFAGLMAVLALVGCGESLPVTPGASSATNGKLAPEIAVTDAARWYNSDPLTLAALRGRPVLLVFWSDI